MEQMPLDLQDQSSETDQIEQASGDVTAHEYAEAHKDKQQETRHQNDLQVAEEEKKMPFDQMPFHPPNIMQVDGGSSHTELDHLKLAEAVNCTYEMLPKSDRNNHY